MKLALTRRLILPESSSQNAECGRRQNAIGCCQYRVMNRTAVTSGERAMGATPLPRRPPPSFRCTAVTEDV